MSAIGTQAELDTVDAEVETRKSARVERAENLDGTTTLAGLARWTVKTAVGGLTGGIGLYNDGTTVESHNPRRRLAVVPSGWAGGCHDKRIPFAVTDGKVYLDNAAIRAASITTAAIANAAITNAKIALATILGANIANAEIGEAHIIDATITGAKIALATILGANIADAEITNAKIGNIIKSTTYNGEDDPSSGSTSQIGTAGWLLNKNGKLVLDLAYVRGTLAAEHIDSDVRNWNALWKGNTLLNSSGWVTFLMPDSLQIFILLWLKLDTVRLFILLYNFYEFSIFDANSNYTSSCVSSFC